VQVPVGSFLSASVLDFVPGGTRAATTLIGLGVASTPPAMAAGFADWSEMTKDRQRVGLIHASSNTIALGLYIASLSARRSGRNGRGKVLALAGLSVAGFGAFLGGHLSYSQGSGMNHAAPDVVRIPEEWTALAELNEPTEGKPTVRRIDDIPVLLYRTGDEVTAMLERCSHLAGPLGDGEVIGTGADACVVCPWHGSTFRLTDGTAVHGPAANDQPVLRSRVRLGTVEVAQP